MGSTTLAADACLSAEGNYLRQNGIPNGTHKPVHTDADTSRMNIEECRLETFKGKWPVQAPVPAEKLAKAGFYYTGHDMEVTCFSCGGCIGEWNYSDSAMEKHKRFFGKFCNFVNNTSNNIPYTSQSKSKPREFNPGSEKSIFKPNMTRGPSFEAANVHPVAPGVGSNAFERFNGQFGESRPTQNGIPFSSNENVNSKRMTFSGNSASGANLTYQENEAMQQPQENRAKGIFMSGNSGVGARVTYNNHEVSRPTGQQQPTPNNSKGIFMNGNSGLGATVTYKEFNVNYPSAGETSSSSERNSSGSSSEDININGVHAQTQAMPSTREQYFNHVPGSTANIFTGPSGLTSPAHRNESMNGIQVQAMPARPTREEFLNQLSSTTPNIFPGMSNAYVGSGTSEVKNYQVEERMKYEAERLKSFQPNWPLTFISPYDLAKAGFYYLMRGDICRCAFCQGVLANWQVGDVPIREHHRNFPLCPFVMGHNVGNVQSYAGDIEMLRNHSSGGQDECGSHSYEMLRNVPERSGSRLLHSSNADEEPGGIRHKGPMHVSQATIEARLRSFQSWPLWSPIKAERLAEAGFFYIGIKDHTKCFYCDIGLCNWEPGDDPWVEHSRWSKNCAFVILLKGEDFVNSCQVIAASRSTRTEENFRCLEPEDTAASPFSSAVDDAMKSSLVQNVLKTKVYPSVLIRKALLRKFRDTGRGVSNVNELSEAVMVELEESWRSRSTPTTEMQTPVVSSSGSLTNGPVVNTCNNLSINSGTIGKPEAELTTEEKLEQVKQQSQENRLCKICMDREIEVAFIPCGHQLACRLCALALKDCAICRKPVERFLRIFLP